MKITASIITLITLYSSYYNEAINISNIKEYYIIVENDTNLKVNELNVYIPSIFPINPIKQKRISSEFGNRFHPIYKKIIFHSGIDISARYGTPIHTTASGKILSIKKSTDGYGKQIEIKHEFGFETLYAHLYTIMVEVGQFINKGEVIGFVGSTGSSTGSHLHYEVKKNKKKIDPLQFCYLDSLSLKKIDYYANENTAFIYKIENQIEVLEYPNQDNDSVPKISESLNEQKTKKRKRRNENESFGNMGGKTINEPIKNKNP